MPMEQFRKRGRGLVANPACNLCDPLVGRFQEKRSFLHPACDQIAPHGLADELSEARRECRATEPDAVSEVAKGPGALRLFVDQLKRWSNMRVRHRPQPPAFSGAERLDPAS